jgi:hypothetical protein
MMNEMPLRQGSSDKLSFDGMGGVSLTCQFISVAISVGVAFGNDLIVYGGL